MLQQQIMFQHEYQRMVDAVGGSATYSDEEFDYNQEQDAFE
jgi:hypothetical protein